ncbi:hypothetical protein [Streptomyces sp. V4I2]|uniref:hypothetical protein n=1 Tax=Streptomyces sp. V4I2 TaxID=3042280 RepID=UPI00278A8FE9|nr:hypothetical protein [Streptomyces sp. V4I2]MDQ1042659.1 hypothetical protein [Streptomyces sp. V4I2]
MPMETGEPDRGRRAWRDRLVRPRAIAGLLAGTAGPAVLGAVLVVLPGVVVDHDLAGASVAAQDRLKAVNDVRTTLLQAGGGMVLLFGAYATWRQLRVSQDGLRVADLRGSDLSTAGLLQTRLTGAVGSEHTRWPAGFDHAAAAGVVVAEDPGPEPPPLLQPSGTTTQHPPLRSVP